MTALLTTLWVATFLVAAIVLLTLLHTERHTDHLAPVAALAVTLLFLPPVGLIAAAVFWIRQHQPSHLADEEQHTSVNTAGNTVALE